MKVINIIKPVTRNSLIDELLSKHLTNDLLFERCYFAIAVTELDSQGFLYRKLWETVYLRRIDHYSSHNADGSYEIDMSLAEAISFIRSVTPPLFNSHMEEQFESIDMIYDMLRHYLMEENDQLSYHISVFRKGMMLNKFETHSNYNTDRMDILRKFNPKGLVVDVEAIGGDATVADICNDNDVSSSVMQLMFFSNTSDLHKLVSLLDDYYSTIRIINVFEGESAVDYFIEVTLSYLPFEKNKVGVRELIKKTYQKILKQ